MSRLLCACLLDIHCAHISREMNLAFTKSWNWPDGQDGMMRSCGPGSREFCQTAGLWSSTMRAARLWPLLWLYTQKCILLAVSWVGWPVILPTPAKDWVWPSLPLSQHGSSMQGTAISIVYRGLSAGGIEDLPEAGVYTFSVYAGDARALAGNLCATAMAIYT